MSKLLEARELNAFYGSIQVLFALGLEVEAEQDLRGAVIGAERARFEQPAHFFVVPR